MYLLIFNLIFEFEKRILLNFLLNRLVSNSGLISTVLSLKYSLCTWYVNVLTVLWICPNHEFLDTLRTFHSEFIDFGRMKITYPCLNCIETDSLGNHIFTTFTSYMKWSLVSDFSASHSLSFNNFERLFFSKLAFLRWYFFGIVVFWYIEVIGTGSC